MKRNSVAFPIILVLVGILFLISNLNPNIPVLRIVGQYWPFLLIGWGVIRAGEILYAHSQKKQLPIAGMSGGEWVLIIFLMLIGTGIAGINRFSQHFPFSRLSMRGLEILGEPYDYPVSGSVPADKTQQLILENLRGNIRIVGGNTAEVKATGRTTIRAYNESEARSFNDQIPFEMLSQGDQIIIRTNQERLTGESRASSDLDITVPKKFSVICRGRYGDFDISGISGSVEVNSDNAGVRLHEIGGNAQIDLRRSDIVRATNIKGTIEIKGRGDDLELENIEGQVTIQASYSGDIQLRNLSQPVRYESSNSSLNVAKIQGNIRMTRGELIGNSVTGPIQIRSRLKDVRLSDFTDTVNIDVDRGDIELRPGKLPLAKLDIRTRNGDVELALPEAAKFNLNATTDRGEVDNSFASFIQQENKDRGGSLRSSGTTGPAIGIHTDRGRIFIRKSGADDKPWDVGEELPSRGPAPPRPPKPPNVLAQ